MARPFTFTADGLKLFELILRTCPPEPTNGGEAAKKYLLALAGEKRSVTFKEIEENILKMFILMENPPAELERMFKNQFKLSVFGHIMTEARRCATRNIDNMFVAEYFGGDSHGNDVRAWTEKMKEAFPDKFTGCYCGKSFVSHMLVVAEATEVNDDRITAIYRNEDGHGVAEVTFKNLKPFPELTIIPGKKFLCHHSSILAEATPDMAVLLYNIQSINSYFMEQVRAIGALGIDHRAMLSFPWAEKASEHI